VYYGLDADPALFEIAVRALAEGNSLRATARIIQVYKDTVCVLGWIGWRSTAALSCCISGAICL
jgi:hypothetical protein